MVEEKVTFVVSLMTEYPRLAAGLFGLVASFFVTQFFKSFLPDSFDDRTHRRASQAIAFGSCYVFTLGFWAAMIPGGFRSISLGHWTALADAFASPTLYWATMRALYWKWPSLETVISGRPRNADADSGVPKA